MTCTEFYLHAKTLGYKIKIYIHGAIKDYRIIAQGKVLAPDYT